MSAISELIVLLIFVLLGVCGLAFIFLTFKVRRSNKPWTLLTSFLFIFLIFCFRSCEINGYKNSQLHQVGIYYLTNFPNCDDCILELKEDMTYQVRSKNKVIENSNWHFESGGDYWITYLDNDRSQLGSGDYAYKKYHLKYPEQKD
jgi:hypothetical protein